MHVHLPESGQSSSQPRLRNVLGGGRHGTVFLAELSPDTAENTELVAVKVAPPGATLEAEAVALRRFAHPNVVTLVDDSSPEALVLEHCTNGTLADAAASGPLAVTELAPIVLGVEAAVAAIHVDGWIHGDISPDNIGLRGDNTPALLDFSTAREADGEPITQGTELYAGALSSATSSLDTRCFAATILACLGEPLRWDVQTQAAKAQLLDLLAKLDTGAEAPIGAVSAIICRHAGAIPEPVSTPPARAERQFGGPTRDYGPADSAGDGDDDPPAPKTLPLRMILLAALIITTVVLAAELILGGPSTEPANLATGVPAAGLPTATGSETLEIAGARWHSGSGTLTFVEDNGSETTWEVGSPGDLAAVADWDCDGTPTLGVYRPSTQHWFEFTNWRPGSLSSIDILANAPAMSGEDLLIVIDAASGCETLAVPARPAT